MDICYETEKEILKAIGFESFITAALSCMGNGSLTIVVQDQHAIQINKCEKYKSDEISNIGGGLKV